MSSRCLTGRVCKLSFNCRLVLFSDMKKTPIGSKKQHYYDWFSSYFAIVRNFTIWYHTATSYIAQVLTNVWSTFIMVSIFLLSVALGISILNWWMTNLFFRSVFWLKRQAWMNLHSYLQVSFHRFAHFNSNIL